MYKGLVGRQVLCTNQNLRNNLRCLWRQKQFEVSVEGLDQRSSGAECASYANLLRWCGTAKALADGRRIHELIIRSGHEHNSFLAQLLVQMYGDCGSLDDARTSFVNLHRRDKLVWTFIISAYARHGQGQEALHFFGQMQQDGVTPDKFIFSSILSACTSQASLANGREVHCSIVNYGLESDVVVGTALVNMYGKCGRLDNAERIFNKMPERNIFTWNSMIAAYALHDHGKAALQLFDQMQGEAVAPNEVTFISIFSACTSEIIQAKAKQLHARIGRSKFECDIVLRTALFNVYGKCGSVQHARVIFDEMPERNLVSWNALITAYAQHEQGKDCLQLFEHMCNEGVLPNKVTFVGILSACAIQGSLFKGKRIHVHITSSAFDSDIIVGNALVNMYGKCSTLQDAWTMFNSMPERNIVSWTAMISACGQHGEGSCSLQLFNQMQGEGLVPNMATVISILCVCADSTALMEGKRMHSRLGGTESEVDLAVVTALVTMYGKCGSVNDAWHTFNQTCERNIFAWTAIIAAYVNKGDNKKAIFLFQQMQHEGITPDKVILISILSACASHVAVGECKRMHVRIAGCAFSSDVVVGNSLVHMYGKCGNLDDARIVFDKMPTHNLVSWNTMIAVYAQHGLGNDAFLLFYKMLEEGMIPDKATFVSILHVCSHAGLLNEGCRFFVSMNQDYGIRPILDHYNCMVDLLGRAGQLDGAEVLINSMPLGSTAVSWMALLFACKNQVDVERGKRVAKQVLERNPGSVAPYVTLSSIHIAAESEIHKTNTTNIMSIY